MVSLIVAVKVEVIVKRRGFILQGPLYVRPHNWTKSADFCTTGLYFKAVCPVRSHCQHPIYGLKIEGPL